MKRTCPNCDGELNPGTTYCPKCGDVGCLKHGCHRLVSFAQRKCPRCKTDMGYGMRREINSPIEKKALDKRYNKRSKGNKFLNQFEQQVAEKSTAVINMKLPTLKQLAEDEREGYTNYLKLVEAGARNPAKPANDRQRRTVEAFLFLDDASEIIYAALSLDGCGLASYGPISVQLNSEAIADRTALLEENSYDFMDNHWKNLPEEWRIPPGHRTLWEDRQRLAVIKNAEQLKKVKNATEFPRILLYSDGDDRKNDRFMEVHIYEGFDRGIIDGIHIHQGALSQSQLDDLQGDIEDIQDLLMEEEDLKISVTICQTS